MDVPKTIEGLNRILSLEYAAVFQYLQHSYLVQGLEREYLRGFFRSQAQEGMDKHAKWLGEKIVALDGVPTVEPGPIKQATDATEMLQQDLELERACQEAQRGLWVEVQGDAADEVALRLMLEEMILEEQWHIEYVEMLLAEKRPAIAAKEIRLERAG